LTNKRTKELKENLESEECRDALDKVSTLGDSLNEFKDDLIQMLSELSDIDVDVNSNEDEVVNVVPNIINHIPLIGTLIQFSDAEKDAYVKCKIARRK